MDLDDFRTRMGERWRWARPVLRSRYPWLGLLAIIGGGLVLMLLVNFAVMPVWTRHGAEIEVPEVRQLAAEEAERVLRRAGLRAELRQQPFNPNLDPDVVVEQNPLPNTSVKPGRRVYYYVNASPRELVSVPDVVSQAERNARLKIEEAGLVITDVVLDTLHNPYEGTVTRQTPRGGHTVPRGTRVTLWLSPGLGSAQVAIPDVVGLTPRAAAQLLREAGLWVPEARVRGDTVRWVHRANATTPLRPGMRLREGEEVILESSQPPRPPEPPRPDTTATPTPEPEPAEPAEEPQPEPPATEPAPPPAEVPKPEPPAEEPKPPTDDQGAGDEDDRP